MHMPAYIKLEHGHYLGDLISYMAHLIKHLASEALVLF